MSGQKHAFHTTLYFRVICGIVIGVLVGFLFPETAQSLKPLGDAFIKLIKMMIAPIIFLHRCGRHRQDGAHEGCRPGWNQGPDLF